MYIFLIPLPWVGLLGLCAFSGHPVTLPTKLLILCMVVVTRLIIERLLT